jgi:hypothetical protein
MKARGLNYGTLPPEGYLLAHNFVKIIATDQAHGEHGFRRFWIPPEWVEQGEWVECDCGWHPDLGIHYRGRAAATSG